MKRKRKCIDLKLFKIKNGLLNIDYCLINELKLGIFANLFLKGIICLFVHVPEYFRMIEKPSNPFKYISRI